MSTFANPWQALPGVEEWNRVSGEFAAPLQKDFTAAMGLVTNPAATLAAASAVGFGLAAHAVGFWVGVAAGAAQVSQRLFVPIEEGEAPSQGRKPAGEVVAMPERSKPALKVVPKAEPVEAEPVETSRVKSAPATKSEKVAQPALETGSAAKSDKENVTGPAKTAAATTTKAKAGTAKAPAAQPAAAAVDMLREGPRKPGALDRPEKPDDLKAISGIGPKLEKVLNDLGIWTYAQIAGWSKQEIAWVDDYLSFKGRIDRDGWIEQAAKLAAGGAKQG